MTLAVRWSLETLRLIDLEDDPYPVLAWLRRDHPVAYAPMLDRWLVTRWADCERIAGDAAAFPAPTARPTMVATFGVPNVLTVDGDQHRALRAPFEAPFRPRAVQVYIDDLVRPVALGLVDGLFRNGSVELMDTYFEPLSVRAFAGAMGIGDVGDATLRTWFHGLGLGATNHGGDPNVQAVADAVCREIEEVLEPLVERRRREPDRSGLSQMIHTGTADGHGRRLEEILPTLKIALLGGMQEPGHGAGSALLGLLTNDRQRAAVVADGSLVADVVREGLRWLAPVGFVSRTAARDITVNGVEVPAGAEIDCVIASANRDETRFDRPEDFDIFRTQSAYVAFGYGRHFCAGHYFAREVMRIGLEVLLEACPGIRLDADRPAVVRGFEFRAPRELNVRVGA